MRALDGSNGFAATKPTPASGSERRNTLACGSEDPEWFYDVARDVLGKDAGLHLHYITGYPESSCYAYTARDATKRRRPPEHFLRKLFHAPQGKPFHAAFMHGCAAQWWLEQQRAAEVGRKVLDIAR